MAIEHADFEGIERLALVLGGEIVSTFTHPEKAKLGSCKLIEEVMIGEDRVSGGVVIDPSAKITITRKKFSLEKTLPSFAGYLCISSTSTLVLSLVE